MRPLLLSLLLVTATGCATVSPYGDSNTPPAAAEAYAERLLAQDPETLTVDEREFLLVYAQQAEARNTQARAQFEQNVFFVSAGLSLLIAILAATDE